MEEHMDEQIRLHDDVVVLVPGFLGFSVIGQFPYFADRVPATLAALLRERWGRDVSIVPASTVPTGGLRERITNLSEFLGKLRDYGAQRFYLLGHSTGGVDAQLFMTSSPFWDGSWPESVQELQGRVKKVVTISAPHYGTSLLDSAAAKFVAHPLSLQNVKGLVPLLEAAAPLADLFGKDLPQVLSLADVSALQFPDVVRFLDSVRRHHGLLDELTPKFMAIVRENAKANLSAKLTCFVTGASVSQEGRKSDPFYAELHGFGQMDNAASGFAVNRNIDLLRQAEVGLWIHNPRAQRFEISASANDGIVNTARQLLPEAALGGIAVGDHADVLGHYDRVDLSTGKPMNTGVFRSGAGFGDDEFIELYRRVAGAF
jgi:pimeloyl-ACP methyl ester carboxylesterase